MAFVPSEDSDQPQISLWLAWASAQSDQSLRLYAQWVGKNPSFLHADSENSDQTAQSSLGAKIILLV